MRPAARISLVALGLAAAVYGAASLTGGWLGTPPYWWRGMTDEEIRHKCLGPEDIDCSVDEYRRIHDTTNRRLVRVRDLKPGEAEQRIEAHEVKDIAGKVRASQVLLEKKFPDNAVGPLREHLTVDVYAHPNFLVAHTRVQADGSFRLHGLPPGTYLMSVEIFHGDFGHCPKSKRVEAGTTDLVIDLD